MTAPVLLWDPFIPCWATLPSFFSTPPTKPVCPAGEPGTFPSSEHGVPSPALLLCALGLPCCWQELALPAALPSPRGILEKSRKAIPA